MELFNEQMNRSKSTRKRVFIPKESGHDTSEESMSDDEEGGRKQKWFTKSLEDTGIYAEECSLKTRVSNKYKIRDKFGDFIEIKVKFTSKNGKAKT